MAVRYDTYTIKAEKTKEGFIRDEPVIGRVGILKYKNPDGTPRYEYRPPEEAFNADSLETLKGMPITIGHHGMVSKENWSKVIPVGTVMSSGRQDGDNIRADVVIYNLPTSARELSCGYKCDTEETPGTTPDGQHYDAIQRNIRYNHVAIVRRARAGSIARLNMDGDEEFNEEEKVMDLTKIRLDSGIEYDTAPEVKVAYEKLQANMKEQQGKMDGLQAKYDTLLADSEKEKKAHEDELKKVKENFDAAVTARIEILETAKKFNIEKADSMTEKEVKLAVIKAVHGDSLKMDGKSDEYINACYDMAKTQHTKQDDGMASQRTSVNKPASHQDGNDDKYMTIAEREAKLRADEAALWEKEVK